MKPTRYEVQVHFNMKQRYLAPDTANTMGACGKPSMLECKTACLYTELCRYHQACASGGSFVCMTARTVQLPGPQSSQL